MSKARAEKRGPRTDQKKRSEGTPRDGKVNQYRARTRGAVGSHPPAGDGPGTTKVKREHDDVETVKAPLYKSPMRGGNPN